MIVALRAKYWHRKTSIVLLPLLRLNITYLMIFLATSKKRLENRASNQKQKQDEN